MNAIVMSLISEATASRLSPPMDELDKITNDYIKAVAELLDSDQEEALEEIADGTRKLMEARESFVRAGMLKMVDAGTASEKSLKSSALFEKSRAGTISGRVTPPAAQTKRAGGTTLTSKE